MPHSNNFVLQSSCSIIVFITNLLWTYFWTCVTLAQPVGLTNISNVSAWLLSMLNWQRKTWCRIRVSIKQDVTRPKWSLATRLVISKIVRYRVYWSKLSLDWIPTVPTILLAPTYQYITCFSNRHTKAVPSKRQVPHHSLYLITY